ncbi:DUF2630 family protein [Mucilaginibacter terrae]|uniref:Uncharacterized protein YigA (DUF484 family) n=1 Tax=Mucilaginibacter terrae TaxID=1955052 RepID=A0ABU3GZX0_9SPHI|nr:DUF2630 family protein [Mucilaginibacter terrae]MDT3405316.1 uncharacterized protein YigA (DUF484 family) [Mucilaginibacter terrae]
MEDGQILHHIKKLTETEEQLWTKAELNEQEVDQLHRMKLELDQCWDLLRHRRALRDSGQNPDKAQPRDIDSIENDVK